MVGNRESGIGNRRRRGRGPGLRSCSTGEADSRPDSRFPIPDLASPAVSYHYPSPFRDLFGTLCGPSGRPERVFDVAPIFGFYSVVGPYSAPGCPLHEHPFRSPPSARGAGSDASRGFSRGGDRDRRAGRDAAHGGVAEGKAHGDSGAKKRRRHDSIAPDHSHGEPKGARRLRGRSENAGSGGFCRESGIGNRESGQREAGQREAEPRETGHEIPISPARLFARRGSWFTDSRFPIPDSRERLVHPPSRPHRRPLVRRRAAAERRVFAGGPRRSAAALPLHGNATDPAGPGDGDGAGGGGGDGPGERSRGGGGAGGGRASGIGNRESEGRDTRARESGIGNRESEGRDTRARESGIGNRESEGRDTRARGSGIGNRESEGRDTREGGEWGFGIRDWSACAELTSGRPGVSRQLGGP